MSRSEPHITVTCDACGTATEIPITARVEEDLKEDGWIYESESELDFCCEYCHETWKDFYGLKSFTLR